jgi:F-type H+-transporting ATPase subunit gamma
LEVAGKRGISALKFRGIPPKVGFTQFDDKPRFDEIDVIATRYLDQYITGQLDRLDVVYTKFESVARQHVVIETLLPLAGIDGSAKPSALPGQKAGPRPIYEFVPSPASILEEVVPASFKVKLFKCFLDSAVSEQIARMVAMKSATENAGDLIRLLSMQYNRARQGRITAELMDVIGGVEALS